MLNTPTFICGLQGKAVLKAIFQLRTRPARYLFCGAAESETTTSPSPEAHGILRSPSGRVAVRAFRGAARRGGRHEVCRLRQPASGGTIRVLATIEVGAAA